MSYCRNSSLIALTTAVTLLFFRFDWNRSSANVLIRCGQSSVRMQFRWNRLFQNVALPILCVVLSHVTLFIMVDIVSHYYQVHTCSLTQPLPIDKLCC